jgi:hypothetical protein
MSQGEEKARRLWSFTEGMIGHDESIKGFRVVASDGQAGKVSWASYAPGESYLVVNLLHHLREAHHVVPAGAVERISAGERTVWLSLTRAQVEAAPEQLEPSAPLDHPMLDAIRSASATWGLGGDM